MKPPITLDCAQREARESITHSPCPVERTRVEGAGGNERDSDGVIAARWAPLDIGWLAGVHVLNPVALRQGRNSL